MRKCRLCREKKFIDVINFGSLPVGYPIGPSVSTRKKVWVKDLKLVMCTNCRLIQAIHTIPKKEYEYHVTRSAGVPMLLREEDKKFAVDMASLLSLAKDALIVDIGCGDGGVLRAFKTLGYKRLIGIDPALLAERYPFEAIRAYFDNKLVNRLKREGKQPDCVILKYVIHLLYDPTPFLARLSRLTKGGSYLVFEVPYIIDIFKNRRVDATGHLRCNWFTIGSLDFALRMHGFNITYVTHDPSYKAGTLRVFAKRGEVRAKSDRILREWKQKEDKILTAAAFKSFRGEISALKKTIRAHIARVKKEKVPIYGYGGGFKAAILASWLGLTSADIRMVVDEDPEKQGKFLPISYILVKSVSNLLRVKEMVAVINFALDYEKKVNEFLIKNLKKGSSILIFFPKFRVITV